MLINQFNNTSASLRKTFLRKYSLDKMAAKIIEEKQGMFELWMKTANPEFKQRIITDVTSKEMEKSVMSFTQQYNHQRNNWRMSVVVADIELTRDCSTDSGFVDYKSGDRFFDTFVYHIISFTIFFTQVKKIFN